MTPPLTVDAVTVAYGPAAVLRDVTVLATPGHLVAVTGASGAGKTSLLWAMAGLLRPARGAVAIGATPLRDREHALDAGIVLIPQDNGLAAILTAQENVLVALVAAGVRPAEARRRAAEALGR